jgi:hypothetical protein
MIGSLALVVAACAPQDPRFRTVEKGMPIAAVQHRLAGLEPFARSCDDRTYFPGDPSFAECREHKEFIDIYRDARWHYAITFDDGRVVAVSVEDHTLPWT